MGECFFLIKIMKKGLRKLTIKNTKPGNSEMGGVNEGIVRSPLQSTHGKPHADKIPRLGAKSLPNTKASMNDLGGGKKNNTGNVKNTGKTITNSKNARKELGKVNQGKMDDMKEESYGFSEKAEGKKTAPKKRKMSAIAKETKRIKMKMNKKPAYAV